MRKTNSFWFEEQFKSECNDFFYNNVMPDDVNDIEVDKIVLSQFSTHLLFDTNKNPLDIIFRCDYINGNVSDECYDLKSLREHLINHKNIISVSEILNIPYYNATEEATTYLTVDVLVESWFIKEILKSKLDKYVMLFPSDKTSMTFDYLNIKQFLK